MCPSIYFRFKSEKDKSSVGIDGSDIPVKMLKDKICDMKKLKEDMTLKKKGPNPNYSLVLMNSETGEEYSDDKTLIPAGTLVIAKRVLSSFPNTIPVHENTTSVAQSDLLILKPREEETVASHLAKMIVTGTLPSILACYLCHSRLKDPYITSCCGFTACKACFSMPACPKCNKSIEIVQDKQLQIFLLSIENELNDLSGITEILNNAKYFLLQVYSHQSLSNSVQNSIWDIPPDNSYRLNTSFQEKRNVILIFVNSANSKFHGFAVLMSPVIHRKQGAVINIKWIRRADMAFAHMSRLHNPIQRDSLTQPVEEIPSSSGLELCLMIEQLEQQEEITPFKPLEIEEAKEEVVKEEVKANKSPVEEKTKSPSRYKNKEHKRNKHIDSPKRRKHKEKHKNRR
ncbi:hypothetical protein SteCoe_12744 [Stentor coeruleus]|uniref:DWNN domain-containing protein n=1 Tax=Stentor coeruleus TaxID=5963 RepID=A0A1R2CA08_9CILI|nr:hypothetical protein SteCoe_12744 [Stentor coeruleus]